MAPAVQNDDGVIVPIPIVRQMTCTHPVHHPHPHAHPMGNPHPDTQGQMARMAPAMRNNDDGDIVVPMVQLSTPHHRQ